MTIFVPRSWVQSGDITEQAHSSWRPGMGADGGLGLLHTGQVEGHGVTAQSPQLPSCTPPFSR